MTPQWFRLLNPLHTLAPPAVGSQPEIVLSPLGVPTDPVLINDDWRDTAPARHIAISTTDGTRRDIIRLTPGLRPDDDYIVMLAHPTRLWVRTDRTPEVGSWVREAPTREIAEAEHRRGHTITKPRRR